MADETRCGAHSLEVEADDTLMLRVRGDIHEQEAIAIMRRQHAFSEGKRYVLLLADVSGLGTITAGARRAFVTGGRGEPPRGLVCFGASFRGRSLWIPAQRSTGDRAPERVDWFAPAGGHHRKELAMRSLWVVSVGFAAGLACSPATPSVVEPPAPASSAPVAQGSAPAVPAVSAAPTPASSASPTLSAKPQRSCGELGCRLFDTPEEAFAEVLKARPRFIGIGETHAQKGSEAVSSTTKRFTELLLPLLAGQTSDLVLELWVADGRCGKQTEQKVATQQKEVTEKQADTNQNEFVTLGNKAVSLGVKPHVLRPGCDDYDRIVKAGPDGVPLMLAMITRLTSQKVRELLQRNESAGSDKMVLAYGGAMHNDLVPKQGREEWSYGPEFSALMPGKYIEIDLIVPQFIQNNPSWQGLAWFPHFDKDKHPDKVTLYQPSPGSYVLIFASK